MRISDWSSDVCSSDLEGYAFLDAEGAARFNEIAENPPTGVNEYVVAPTDLRWVAFFSFNEVGYVKDDEKLDPDDILSSIREGTEASNIERERRSEEHTSELQSLMRISYAVFSWKKKNDMNDATICNTTK